MSKQWNAIVLAADRGLSDPVARVAGVEGKAFATLQNITLIERVISALHECHCINKIYTVGPQHKYLANNTAVHSFLTQHNVNILQPASGPSASAMHGVAQSDYYPTLIITCDLALINADIIEQYCTSIADLDADFVACAIDYQHIQANMPELKKTQYHFARQTICFANVFAVLTPNGLRAIEYWQEIEKSRKKPIELIGKIDWWGLLSYKLRRLSLQQVTEKLSSKTGAQLKIVNMQTPELAIDVDSADDYQVMKNYLEN